MVGRPPLAIGSDGLVQRVQAGDVPLADGYGFPAAPVASNDPNTLDDYREGTFSPVLAFAGASTGVAYAAGGQVGRFTKIGRIVCVEGRITLTSKGGLSGAAAIGGLPFAAISPVPAGPFRYMNVALTLATVMAGYLNGSAIQLQVIGASGSADATAGMLTNTTDIMFTATYHTAA